MRGNDARYYDDGRAHTYLGPRQSVYACAGYNRIQGEFFGEAATNEVDGSAWAGSYGYNYWGLGLGLGGQVLYNISGGEFYRPLRETAVVNPSDMIEVGDAVLWGIPQAPAGSFILSAWGGGLFSWDGSAQDPAWKAIASRHSGRWNIVFCDVHVENLKSNQLFDIQNPAVAQRWNCENQAP